MQDDLQLTNKQVGGAYRMYCWLQGGDGAASGSELNLRLWLEQRGEGRGLESPDSSWRRAPPPSSETSPPPQSPAGLLLCGER